MADVDVPLKPNRWRSRLGVAGLIFLVAAVIAGLTLGIRSIQSARAYEAAVERYRAAGCPMDVMAFQPAALPPGTDGTAAYFLALDLDEGSYRVEPPDSKKVVSSEDPRLGLPEGNEVSEEEWTERRALVREHAAQLRLLKEAAVAGPVRFPLHYEDRWAMLMPHVTRLVASSKLLYWDARIAAKDGKSAEAWGSVDAILAASDAVETEPPMVSQLVRLVNCDYGLEAMEFILDSAGPPPEPVRARLEGRLAAGRFRAGMRRACLMEVAMVQDTISQFVGGGKMLPGLDVHRGGLAGMMTLPEFQRGGARCLDRLVRMHALLEQPPTTSIPQLDAITQEFNQDPTSFAFLIPALTSCLRREGELSARLLLAREALRIREGPPGALPTLPKDPLTGRSLLFHPTDKGFTLRVDLTDAERESLWKSEKPLLWSCPR